MEKLISCRCYFLADILLSFVLYVVRYTRNKRKQTAQQANYLRSRN